MGMNSEAIKSAINYLRITNQSDEAWTVIKQQLEMVHEPDKSIIMNGIMANI
jgi:hypothetical protein